MLRLGRPSGERPFGYAGVELRWMSRGESQNRSSQSISLVVY